MRRRSRTRRVLKCVGAAACGLILVVQIVALRWQPAWGINRLDCAARLMHGGVLLFRAYEGYRFPGQFGGPSVSGVEWFCEQGLGTPIDASGKFVRAFTKRPARTLGWRWMPSISTGWPFSVAFVPYWIPFAIVVAPTGLLWWRDRRIPLGHCQHCGCNLTGNVSGRCPECGALIERAGDTR